MVERHPDEREGLAKAVPLTSASSQGTMLRAGRADIYMILHIVTSWDTIGICRVVSYTKVCVKEKKREKTSISFTNDEVRLLKFYCIEEYSVLLSVQVHSW